MPVGIKNIPSRANWLVKNIGPFSTCNFFRVGQILIDQSPPTLLNLLPFTRLPGSVLAENKEIFSEQVYYLKKKEIKLSDQIDGIKRGTILLGHDDERKAEEELEEFIKLQSDENYNEKQTCFKVLDADCLQVADKLIQKTGRIPMVLNLASRRTICGKYWVPYMGTQEEFIERKSVIYRYSIDPDLNEIVRDDLEKRALNLEDDPHHILEFGVTYTPKLPIIRNFKETNDYSLVDPCIFINVAAAGAIDLRIKYFRKTDHSKYCDKHGVLNEELFIKHTKLKIRMVLYCALKMKETDLVLGAFGCGAYLNDAKTVSTCFEQVLNEPLFKNRFENVYFAILGKGNCKPFEETFASYIQQ